MMVRALKTCSMRSGPMSCCWLIVRMFPMRCVRALQSRARLANIRPLDIIVKTRRRFTKRSTRRATWLKGSSINSSISALLQRALTDTMPTISRQ